MATTTTNPFGVGYVQITLHLVNGGKHRFLQTNPAEAATLMEQLRPERIFSQKQIIIAGTDAATVVLTENVERVDVYSDPAPDWQHGEIVRSIQEITEEEFAHIRRATPKPTGPTLPPPPDTGISVGMLAEMRSGAAVPLRLRLLAPEDRSTGRQPLTPGDARAFMQQLFSRHVLFGEIEANPGTFLLNPGNVLRFLLSPPLPIQSLPSVWTMETDDIG